MIDIENIEVLLTVTCVSSTSIKYLHLYWEAPSIFNDSLTDKELKQFIRDEYKRLYRESFNSIFNKVDEANYYLNICTIEQFGNFPWNKQTEWLLKQQIETYKPLIQQFISDPSNYPSNT